MYNTCIHIHIYIYVIFYDCEYRQTVRHRYTSRASHAAYRRTRCSALLAWISTIVISRFLHGLYIVIYVYVYIYLHVCVCVCVCMYIYIYTYTYICIYIHICMYICINICRYTSMRTCVCVNVCVCVCVCVCVRVCVYKYIFCVVPHVYKTRIHARGYVSIHVNARENSRATLIYFETNNTWCAVCNTHAHKHKHTCTHTQAQRR